MGDEKTETHALFAQLANEIMQFVSLEDGDRESDRALRIIAQSIRKILDVLPKNSEQFGSIDNEGWPNIEEWTWQLFALFPNGIQGTLLLDAARERGFDQTTMVNFIRIWLDEGKLTHGDNMQFVRKRLFHKAKS